MGPSKSVGGYGPFLVIAASDVIVNSSLWEPRSQVIHQAFAMKKLVVASNKGGNVESIADGETGFLFCSEDPGSLSETILRVLNKDTGPMKEKAYLSAHSALGIDTMMKKTLSVYRATLTARQSLQNELHLIGPPVRHNLWPTRSGNLSISKP
mgnify:CR=1 FL=1